MTRLEFVSMSLTKGLKGVISINGEQEIVTLKSIDTDGNEIWVSNDNWVYSSLNYDIKIICRTLSDLTKEIEHKGEKFVPIIELSKIAGLFGSKSKINNFLIERWKIGFKYLNEDECFYLDDHEVEFFYIKNKTEYPIRHQFQLFQKLIEWKFNLMDESEEFINVNDLDINPYK